MNGRDAVIRDDAEAAIWYRRAAEQGNTYAQTFLGHMYANGRGVPQDDAEAVPAGAPGPTARRRGIAATCPPLADPCVRRRRPPSVSGKDFVQRTFSWFNP